MSIHKTKTSNPLDSTNSQQTSKNQLKLVTIFVFSAIAIALSLFWYIFTHGTEVPYLGPIIGQ